MENIFLCYSPRCINNNTSIISKNATLKVAKLFRATILWMDDRELIHRELIQGREFLLKLGTKITPAVVINLKCKLDLDGENQLTVNNAKKNDILLYDLSLSEDIVCSQFEQHKTMGSFMLIDRISNMTSACGRIEYFLRRGDKTYFGEHILKTSNSILG